MTEHSGPGFTASPWLLRTEALALQHRGAKRQEDRILLTPSIKPIVEELEPGEGRRQCFFSIRYEVDVLWEGPLSGETLGRQVPKIPIPWPQVTRPWC